MVFSTRSLLATTLALAVPTMFVAALAVPGASAQPVPNAGELSIIAPDGTSAGVCPLKHTAVTADIIGYVSRTTVTQVFENPTDTKIEAIYVFPLPQDAAVDSMIMMVGDRRIVGRSRNAARRARFTKRQGRRACRQSARPGAAEHLHAVGREYRAGGPGADRDQLRGAAEVRRRRFRMGVPNGGGPRYIPGGGTAPEPLTTAEQRRKCRTAAGLPRR